MIFKPRQEGRLFRSGQPLLIQPTIITSHIGIDQRTAVIVKKNLMTVIGPGSVLITDGAEHGNLPFYVLKATDRFDLATWTKLPSGN